MLGNLNLSRTLIQFCLPRPVGEISEVSNLASQATSLRLPLRACTRSFTKNFADAYLRLILRLDFLAWLPASSCRVISPVSRQVFWPLPPRDAQLARALVRDTLARPQSGIWWQINARSCLVLADRGGARSGGSLPLLHQTVDSPKAAVRAAIVAEWSAAR
jgi:hypothetical protein